jgi:ATP-binding protein involved in chromosome partitioning
MSSPDIVVKKLAQKNNHTFIIEWSDGQINEYHLSTLQRLCPCANCADKKISKNVNIKDFENLRAHKIVSVGRYGLRIYFTSGCSNGIFHFDMLREIGKVQT